MSCVFLARRTLGLAAMGATLIALIALISEFGFDTAVVQVKGHHSAKTCASVFGAALLFGIASFALVALLGPIIGSFYNDQRVTKIVQLAGLTFILASLSTTFQMPCCVGNLNFKNSHSLIFQQP